MDSTVINIPNEFQQERLARLLLSLNTITYDVLGGGGGICVPLSSKSSARLTEGRGRGGGATPAYISSTSGMCSLAVGAVTLE